MVSFAVGTQTFGSVIRPAVVLRRGWTEADASASFRAPASGCSPDRWTRSACSPAAWQTPRWSPMFSRATIRSIPIPGWLPPPRLLDIALTDPPVLPDLAFVKSPVWDQAEPETQQGFRELAEALGERCTEVALPDIFGEWQGAHRALMQAGMARNLAPTIRRARIKLSPPMRSDHRRRVESDRRRLPDGAGLARGAQQRPRSVVRSLRCHRHAGRAWRGAARPGCRPAIRSSTASGRCAAFRP